MERTEIVSEKLKLDGYYFREYNGTVPSLQIYFLYENGIILNGTSTEISNLDYLEEQFRNGTLDKLAKRSKDFWGVFRISGDKFEFERWYPGDPPLQAYVRAGEILNDTTFYITKSYKFDGSNVKERDELYRFKAFSNKPDSTNTFIK